VSGTLTDTSNNVTNVMITIMATAPADTTAPTISLLGSNPIDMTVGGTYTDAGATSSDNIDGDITARIVTTSTVNTTVAGTYLVTYVVSDLAGNGATSTRTVNVAAPAPVVVVSGGGGGGSYTYYGSYGQPVVTTAPAVVSTVVETPVTVVNAAKPAITEKPAGQVLGVETFAFSENLTIGSTGNTVTELQNVLAKEGFFNLSATGYFGQVTKNAVIAYQKAHNINPASGFVGSLTRAELNKVQGGQVLGVSTASGDALRAQIATLQTQLLEIMKQLVEQLKAKQ
ncbi:MAG: Lipoprotein, partial [Candidatus Wolfebacteria bacterium GW2011_GWE1_48_7]